MKHKEGFILRRVGEKHIVLPISEAARDLGAALQLNESGALLWGLLDSDCALETLAHALTQNFDIDGETAVRDTAAFLAKLRGNGLLIE